MSMEEKILMDIENLPREEKLKVLKKIKEKYFNKDSTFVVEDNYDFWLNEKYKSEV